MAENLENEQQAKQNQDRWDIFVEPHEVLDDASSEKMDKYLGIEKAAKLFVYGLSFLVVLCCSVISKGSLLFITAQLNHQMKPYCNKDLDVNQQFVVILPQEEKVAWTWILTFVYFVPQLATFLRSSRILLFKTWNMPSALEFTSVFLSESLTTIGNGILVFCVLPRLNAVRGCMLMNCFGLVPSLLLFCCNIMTNTSRRKGKRFSRIVCLDLLSFIVQGVGLILLTFTENETIIWSLPLSAILISIAWWENYTNDQITRNSSINATITSSKKFPNSRYFIYSVVSLWKCVVFFSILNFTEWHQYGSVDHLYSAFISVFSDHDIIIRNIPHRVDDVVIKSQHTTPIWILTICIVATYFCYIFGKFACKINIQRVSYALPLHLSSPLTMVVLLSMCTVYTNNNCEYANIIPSYLFFNLPPTFELGDLWLFAVWLLLLMSHIWITRHIWKSKGEFLPSTERLYVKPFYEPFLIDQDLGMNRRRFDNLERKNEQHSAFTLNDGDTVPKLYICGTMWHETKEEMLTFLQSIMILDEDHCSRRIARNYLNTTIDYYKLESHIMFDDAFTRTSQTDQQPQINGFVKDLIDSVDDAVSMVHKTNTKLKGPSKFSTPYGGRLEWNLPGKSKLIAHLKDNGKIRSKKRWSQVMYMYYILGHKIVERDDIDNIQKETIFRNTYILAVDGDIHFRPQAIHRLLQHMKKDKNLAAACGRVHPIGNGIFAWYQKFEYAISHWMYKTSENVSGCVLCCPGCFTLFRASAVMSILKKFSTKSTKAVHFIMYDHGEDRWISTLLVLCGYKVGYVASADAYTNCPEGIKELFNQRRRWIPSSTAGILDLVSRTHTVRKVNDNVSILYMVYQTIFGILTLFGPSLVLWMIVNICASIFQMNHWLSLLLNIMPVLIYAIICAYVTSEKIQIQVALVLCGIYTPIMCAFFIGGLFRIINDGFLSPWSLFFYFFLIQILVVVLMHPREIYYLKYLIAYYVMMPTMHMLLFIYTVFNMHKVSWGTREVNKLVTPDTTLETSWPQDESLINGATGNLSDTENKFWTKLLNKYLHPLNDDKEKDKIMNDLKELRDKTATTLSIMNIIFLSIIFLLTSRNVTVEWPLTDADGSNIELELFNTILIFGIFSLFLVQVVSIVIDRFSTFAQIMINTNIQFKVDLTTDPAQLLRGLQRHRFTEPNHIDSLDLEEVFLSSMTNDNNNSQEEHNKNSRLANKISTNGYTNYGLHEDV